MVSKGRGRDSRDAPVEASVEASPLDASTAGLRTPKAIGARIAEARGRRTQAQFAEAVGSTEITVGRYERGDRSPDADFLLACAERENLSIHWLLFGIPPRRLSDAISPDKQRESFWRTYTGGLASELHAGEPPAPGYVQIPLYDLVAGASARGRVVESETVVDALAFKEEWIRQELHVSPRSLRLIHVSGDSMEPDLRAGDIILVDHTDTRASREGIYVIRMDDALLVKQLQRLPGGVVKVISRNPAYEAFNVSVASLESPSGFAIIGRVVWTCRRL